MSEPDVAGLLRHARDSYTSVVATIRSWSNAGALAAAWHQWTARQPRGSVVDLRPDSGGSEAASNGPSQEMARLWTCKPWQWRLESLSGPERGAVLTISGPLWWRQDVHGIVWTNEGTSALSSRSGVGLSQSLLAMLDPASLATDLRLKVVGQAVHATRPCLIVRGEPQDSSKPPIWPGVDEFRLLVDAERGILVHLSAQFEGADCAGDEFMDISFEEQVPSSTFTVTTSAGAVVRRIAAPDVPSGSVS